MNQFAVVIVGENKRVSGLNLAELLHLDAAGLLNTPGSVDGTKYYTKADVTLAQVREALRTR